MSDLLPLLKVSIPHTHRDFFFYYPVDHIPQPGCRVWVPFRNQKKLGIVLGSTTEPAAPIKNIKTIASVVDLSPLISAETLEICAWVAQYYQAPLSEVLALAIPKKYRSGEHFTLPKLDYFQLCLPLDQALLALSSRAKRQRELISWLSEKKRATKKEISAQGFSFTHVQNLIKLGVVESFFTETSLILEPYSPKIGLTLNQEQEAVVNTITSNLDSHQTFLLQGITGSGKTEVYLQVINQVLSRGKQVLILVPEIGLTPQLLARFQERFSMQIAVVHSSLSDQERQHAWHLANNNLIRLVIGTRSAIFTPLPQLGLIILDEEHDASFKQMEGVRYSARDTALMRAYKAKVPVILGSATPSLESLQNASVNKYQLLHLNHKALASLPVQYQVVDIRNQALTQGLASSSLTAIRHHLTQGNQVLVFINRRGFAPVLLCHQCGWMCDCRDCYSHATFHRSLGKMVCHHCGLIQRPPAYCPQCQGTELLPIGVGTQRVEEYLASEFPKTSILRIDKDKTRKKGELARHLDLINNQEAQLIIGTQMLAKGHHFPRLTLVVVLDADNGFYNQDFRALERLGQLLLQVAGRAGRAQWPGEVLIQTHQPQHTELQLLLTQNYRAFADALLASRRQAQLPPFQYLALIRAQSMQACQSLSFLHAIKEKLGRQFIIMGPAPAPLARKGKFYRMQLLLKSASRQQLQTHLAQLRMYLISQPLLQKGVQWNIDVDPIDLS